MVLRGLRVRGVTGAAAFGFPLKMNLPNTRRHPKMNEQQINTVGEAGKSTTEMKGQYGRRNLGRSVSGTTWISKNSFQV
jgi:hypothetical protein